MGLPVAGRNRPSTPRSDSPFQNNTGRRSAATDRA